MERTKTNKLSKTTVCKILKNNKMDFWKNIFVVNNYVYFTDRIRMTRCSLLNLDLENTDIDLVYFEDLKPDKQNLVKDLIKVFDDVVSNVNASSSTNFKYYKVNKSDLKSKIKEVRNASKEITDDRYKHVPITLKIGNTVVNTKYLIDLLSFIKGRTIQLFVNTDSKLSPILISDGKNDVLSILCPMGKAVGLTLKTIKIEELQEG